MAKKLIVLATALLFAGSTAYAGCVDTFGIGAKATSMGGAFTAYADDPFAAYYNPAGIHQIKAPTLAVGVHMIQPDVTIKDVSVINTADPTLKSIGDLDSDFPLLIVPHLGYAQPITDKISAGISFYAPYGLEVEWDTDKSGDRTFGMADAYKAHYKRITINPNISYKVSDKLAFGLTVSIGQSTAGEEKIVHTFDNTTASNQMSGALRAISTGTAAAGNLLIEAVARETGLAATGMTPAETLAFYQAGLAGGTVPQQQFAGAVNGLAGSKEIQLAAYLDKKDVEADMTDDLNYSFNLGVMYKPVETITLGLTYRSETETDFEGDFKLDGIKVGDVTLEMNHPQQVQAGIRYAPHPKFSMEMDVVWTNWSINKDQAAVITFNEASGSLAGIVYPKTSPRDWDDTKQLRFGAEYILNDMITLRGGYFYDPSPIPDSTLDLMWPDGDKKSYSLGIGFNFLENRLSIDTVFQYTDLEQDRIIGGESYNMNAAYQDAVQGGIAKATGGGNDRYTQATATGSMMAAGFTVTYRFQ